MTNSFGRNGIYERRSLLVDEVDEIDKLITEERLYELVLRLMADCYAWFGVVFTCVFGRMSTRVYYETAYGRVGARTPWCDRFSALTGSSQLGMLYSLFR
ncbi:hypothetical protein Tcan_12981 [Toxocara canis]|uniref:Uncharacterized protein n=1 Tax=Toxocara canis TaxID=6265 RepID=A0A0B2UT09_TOXCA|nr:hypothetical protein Tcan_12981 [Toxocara canis]